MMDIISFTPQPDYLTTKHAKHTKKCDLLFGFKKFSCVSRVSWLNNCKYTLMQESAVVCGLKEAVS